MARLVFAGTPDFAVPSLAALIAAGHVPSLVLTQPDRPAGRGQQLQPPPVKRLALEHELPVRQPSRLNEVRDELEQLKPEIMVVVAYAHKIPYWLLTLPPMGVLNVHASLLPKYRGASPVAAALLNGDDETGVSIMRLAQGWDTGPVFRQRTLAIQPEDNAGTLTDKLAALGAELLVEVMGLRVRGMITAKPQDESLASYAPKLSKADGRLDWSKPAGQLAREVRAYTPWPGSYTTWQGKMLKVLAATPAASSSQVEPATVLPGLRVATGQGELKLERVQLEGRKPVSAKEFLAGQAGIVGSLLG
ncbi:MAG TPA: methionyl-tRNA formyltransferase [Chloroflexota bacterium]|nr:methionyl-tRNA formyltransferase [Chloroflexota bacterium]